MSKPVKCDACKYQAYTAPTLDDPYPHWWCTKGHWEGPPMDGEQAHAWDDCKDFARKPESKNHERHSRKA